MSGDDALLHVIRVVLATTDTTLGLGRGTDYRVAVCRRSRVG
jgi:hypothetical protein